MSSLRRRVLASHKLNRLRTAWRGLLHPCPEPNFTFIFGCQRSGTTLLRHLIGLDSRVQDYGEGDPPYFWQVPNEDPRYIRLRDDEEIERLRRKERSPIVLLKPLTTLNARGTCWIAGPTRARFSSIAITAR